MPFQRPKRGLRLARSAGSADSSFATGLPRRAMMISSPRSTAAISSEKWVFASWMFTWRMQPLSLSPLDLVHLVHSPLVRGKEPACHTWPVLARLPFRRVASLLLRVALVVAGVVVFLTLTGIIAEPETVIENIVRFVLRK